MRLSWEVSKTCFTALIKALSTSGSIVSVRLGEEGRGGGPKACRVRH